ncbi:MAG: MFS transporter [Chloroflexi bacterium]|nr:MFS transporter [Chloroflexota bacterium]
MAITASVSQAGRADVLIARMERLPFTRKHWLVAAVLCTATFFDGYDNLMITAALPLILAFFKVPLASAGVLVAATFWGQLFGSPVAGVIAERFGRRTVLLASCGIMGATAILSALAQDFNQLLVARAIQGVGVGAEIPIAGAMFNEFVRSTQRGGAVFAYETMFAWGGYVAPWIALGCVAVFGQDDAWRAMFVFGALPVLMIFIRKRALPESPRWLLNQERTTEAEAIIRDFERSATHAHQPLAEPVVVVHPVIQKTRFRELFEKPYRGRTIMMLVWIMTTYAYTYGYAPFVAALYTTVGGLPITGALLLTVAGQAITIPYNYFVALTVDRFGRKFYFGWGLLFAAVVMAVGAVLVGPLGLTTWPVLFVLTQLAALGTVSTIGFYVYAPELFPTRMRAWATATGSTGIRLVSSFMPIVVGVTAASAFGLPAVYVLMGICLAVGGLTLLRFGPETRGRVLEDIAA